MLDSADVLVQHPYESFASSVEAFVDQAVSDPDVLAIKQTLYRTSGPDSPIVRSLIRAAESGKQVVALVELTARFDEQANITWAEELEKAGVHVVYGVVGLKTHAKATLVVRRTNGGIRRYCHMGTGNYNSATARLYEDIGLLSSNEELGEDLTDLFNYLTGYSRQRQYRRLLVAPVTLRSGIVELIRTQTHSTGRIIIKCNHLIDPEVIEALYAASCAGARIDLIVRSSCGVRPGIAGMSENIWVRSLVRSLPRALAALSLRARPLVHRLGGPHGAQPRRPDRDRGTGDGPEAAGTAHRDRRRAPCRRRARLGAAR